MTSQQDLISDANVERLLDELELAGLDLRHVENVVDHMQQVLAAFMDQAGIVAVALLARARRTALD